MDRAGNFKPKNSEKELSRIEKTVETENAFLVELCPIHHELRYVLERVRNMTGSENRIAAVLKTVNKRFV